MPTAIGIVMAMVKVPAKVDKTLFTSVEHCGESEEQAQRQYECARQERCNRNYL